MSTPLRFATSEYPKCFIVPEGSAQHPFVRKYPSAFTPIGASGERDTLRCVNLEPVNIISLIDRVYYLSLAFSMRNNDKIEKLDLTADKLDEILKEREFDSIFAGGAFRDFSNRQFCRYGFTPGGGSGFISSMLEQAHQFIFGRLSGLQASSPTLEYVGADLDTTWWWSSLFSNLRTKHSPDFIPEGERDKWLVLEDYGRGLWNSVPCFGGMPTVDNEYIDPSNPAEYLSQLETPFAKMLLSCGYDPQLLSDLMRPEVQSVASLFSEVLSILPGEEIQDNPVIGLDSGVLWPDFGSSRLQPTMKLQFRHLSRFLTCVDTIYSLLVPGDDFTANTISYINKRKTKFRWDGVLTVTENDYGRPIDKNLTAHAFTKASDEYVKEDIQTGVETQHSAAVYDVHVEKPSYGTSHVVYDSLGEGEKPRYYAVTGQQLITRIQELQKSGELFDDCTGHFYANIEQPLTGGYNVSLMCQLHFPNGWITELEVPCDKPPSPSAELNVTLEVFVNASRAVASTCFADFKFSHIDRAPATPLMVDKTSLAMVEHCALEITKGGETIKVFSQSGDPEKSGDLGDTRFTVTGEIENIAEDINDVVRSELLKTKESICESVKTETGFNMETGEYTSEALPEVLNTPWYFSAIQVHSFTFDLGPVPALEMDWKVEVRNGGSDIQIFRKISGTWVPVSKTQHINVAAPAVRSCDLDFSGERGDPGESGAALTVTGSEQTSAVVRNRVKCTQLQRSDDEED